MPLCTVIRDINLLDKVLEDTKLHVLVPLLRLLSEPGEALVIGHVEVEEQEQGVVVDKLSEVRPLLLLRPDAADVQLLHEVCVEGEALHLAPDLLQLLPEAGGKDLLVRSVQQITSKGEHYVLRGHIVGVEIDVHTSPQNSSNVENSPREVTHFF